MKIMASVLTISNILFLMLFSFELELELHIACAILNDSLYEPLKADKNKVVRNQTWTRL